MFKSLQWRMVLFFSVLILLTGILLSYVTFSSSTKLITSSVGEQARTVAESAVKMIDLEQYKALSPGKGETEYYTELRAKLNEFKESNGLKYLYTMAARPKDGGGTEYYYMVDGAPADATDDFSAMGDPEEEEFHGLPAAFETKEAQVGELSEDESYGATLTAYVPILDKNGEMIGVMGADLDASHIYDLLKKNGQRAMWITGLVLLVSVAVIYGYTRYVVAPIKRMTREMQRVQEGDLTVQVTVRGKDEVAQLAAGFTKMVADLRSMIGSIKESTEVLHQSAGALSSNLELAGQMREQVSLHIQEAAVGADTQRRAAVETARAMEEVGAGVQRIAESSAVVAEASQSATDSAREGDQSVHQAVRQMEFIHSSARQVAEDIERLSVRSGEVGQIVDTIRDIAAQTNLLALNAAIEAARAGEHGRGFAVVADQVRKLAAQSETSAVQITELISHMQSDTDKAVEAVRTESKEVETGLQVVRAAGETFRHILGEVERVAEQVQEVSAVSEEIAAAAEEVTASVDEIAHMSSIASNRTTDIVSATEQQTAASGAIRHSLEGLKSKADELEDLVERFKV